ncbi:MAG: MBL fold metallo-hydrolase [Pseudomonadota bacterium]
MTLRFILPLLLLFAAGTAAKADDFPARSSPTSVTGSRLVILGTAGGPAPHRFRSQPANLLVVNGKGYVIDAGDGVVRQIVSAGFQLKQVDAVFLTHLHLDHTAGIGTFMAFDWIGRRQNPVSIYGPPGTTELVRTATAHFGVGEQLFSSMLQNYPKLGSLFVAHDIDLTAPAEIYRDDNVKVIAVENSHYSTEAVRKRDHGTDRSYALRFEMQDRTIVFTGDTGPSASVEKLATGADILVSEVIDIPAILATISGMMKADEAGALVEHMHKEHLTPEEVGKLATRAGVKMVVLTHFAGSQSPDTSGFVAGVRRHFKGAVVAAQDLDAF